MKDYWTARARVKGKMVWKRFTVDSDDMEDVKKKARALFPNHKPNNITLTRHH